MERTIEINRDYRSDVNGLRGLAVLLVLLFHLDFSGLQGGFIGVDVFFVISGYFISRNILFDLNNEVFTFKKFYTKRARRLFPAIFFTIAITFIYGFFVLSPNNLERLSQSTIFSILPVSNFYFLSEEGYFNINSEFKPLLHMWSLSLEEQFYFIWPLALVFIIKFLKRHVVLILVITAIVSLLAAQFFVLKTPETVFFMLPFRLFEFLLGALVVWLERYRLNIQYLKELMVIVGVILIVYTANRFNQFTEIPGLLSMIPVLGTMMIIYAGQGTKASFILRNKVMDLLGKTSYSIYLIHWPLIVYYKYWSLLKLTLSEQVLLGLVSILIGYIMWRYIENPFREVRSKHKTDRIWIIMPSLSLLLVIASSIVWSRAGVAIKPPEYYLTLDEILETRKIYWDKKTLEKYLDIGSDRNVLIMGNSHSIDLIYAFRNNGLNANIESLRTFFKCYNFGTPLEPKYEEYCAELLNTNLNSKVLQSADRIYLHDHWPTEDLEDLRNRMKEIRDYTDAPIYVFGPRLTFNKTVTEIVHTSKLDEPLSINRYAERFSLMERRSDLNNKLKEVFNEKYFKNNNFHYIDVLTVQCGEDLSNIEVVSTKTNHFLYFDESHFTEYGATEIGAKLKIAYPDLFF